MDNCRRSFCQDWSYLRCDRFPRAFLFYECICPDVSAAQILCWCMSLNRALPDHNCCLPVEANIQIGDLEFTKYSSVRFVALHVVLFVDDLAVGPNYREVLGLDLRCE